MSLLHVFLYKLSFLSCLLTISAKSTKTDFYSLSAYQSKGNNKAGWCYHDPICGPSTWGGSCQNPDFQSPIDIIPSNTVEIEEEKIFRFSLAYYIPQSTFYVENTGYTVVFSFDDIVTPPFVLTGDDGLESGYKFAQLHFHWGSKNTQGSEHTIDGVSSGLEMHLVHYASRYSSLSEALEDGDPDSLSVLGVLFSICEHDNPFLSTIIAALQDEDVKTPSGKIEMSFDFGLQLLTLLPPNLNLYRYFGSLTTPTCDEVVLWNVFEQHVPISSKQLKAFRMLLDPEGKHLKDNFRPVQSAAAKTVKYYSQMKLHCY